MKNMKPKSQVEKRIDGMSGAGDYTAGTGIEISGKVIKLKTAGKGVSIFDVDQALGGVYIGYHQGLEVDYDGRLYLAVADTSYRGGITIGDGLKDSSVNGHCSINIGKGMRFNPYNDYDPGKNVYYGKSVSPNLGDGLKLDPSEDEEDPDYGKLHLNLGKGLEFGARKYEKKKDDEGNDTEDDDLTRYTSEVQLKLGKGLKFGENGELTATAEGGKEYKAGKNISISEDGTISADVKEYTAGENITISSDGKISATGGGAELAAGGGITIETDGETGKKTISAAVGEGAEIRDGKICTVPNIQNAVLIKEEDAKYLLHNFTEIEYNSGLRIGYTGAQSPVIAQGMFVYKQGGTAPNGVKVDGMGKPDPSELPNIPFYTDVPFSSPVIINGNTPCVRFYIKLIRSTTLSDVFGYYAVAENGTETKIYELSNYDSFSLGFAFTWASIYPPGSVVSGRTYEFGYALCNILRRFKGSATQFQVGYYTNNSNCYVPFASEAEYQAAVGLTYEPITLTRVEDNPTVVSGKDIGEEVT